MGKEKSGVVILSGGLDSTVLTYLLVHEGYKLEAISFDYGQRHIKELTRANLTCARLNIPHTVLHISIPSKSVLLDSKSKLPEEHYTHENQKQTVIPNRNMIMLSFAIAVAEEKGIKQVFYAAHKNDRAIYPDCRPEFVDAISNAAEKATYNKVVVVAPFIDKFKSDIVAIGEELKVHFDETWSCYKGTEKACGKCGTCQERLEAFKINNLKDPIEYENT